MCRNEVKHEELLLQMSQKKVIGEHGVNRKPGDSRPRTKPLTSPLRGAVPLERSLFYNSRGQPAHKVKPTKSSFAQHQRQVQIPSSSLPAGQRRAALILQTSAVSIAVGGQRSAGCTDLDN